MKPRAADPNGVDEAVARILDRIELEDPPEDLKQNVLRAIGTRPEPVRSGWFEALRAEVRRRFVPSLVPFAAGAAAGLIVFALGSGAGIGRAPGSASVEGVMAPIPGTAPGRAAKVDDQRFELAGANVRFEVYRAGDRAGISVRTEGAVPVGITIQPQPGAARVERLLAVPTSPGGVEYGPDGIRIQSSGRDRAEVGLIVEPGAGNAPIRITVTSQGGTVQGSLHATAPAGGEAPAGH